MVGADIAAGLGIGAENLVVPAGIHRRGQYLRVERHGSDWKSTRLNSSHPSFPTRRSSDLSVCAFQASGVPEGMRHLVDGFRHEFVACLARFREWSVRTLPPVWESEPRTWSSPPEYIVEGSTYELNGTVQIGRAHV